jgi:DNA-binding transcriptional MerR regulator
VLGQLALVALGQSAGFSLEEIRSMLTPSGGPRIDRKKLAAKADEVDATIHQLRAVSRGLRHAAACPARSHAECPTFQRLLRAAASGAIDRRLRTNPRKRAGS